MSLYYDAASVLSLPENSGSLKSRIYAKDAKIKSKPAHLYALISEAAKYDTFLKEVIDNAGILSLEPKLTPLLSLLLIHDHFFAKRGIAAPATHFLRQTIDRHKARLQSEFTKARIRRKQATVEQLKVHLSTEKIPVGRIQPRWARINTLRTTVDELLAGQFAGYENASSLDRVVSALKEEKILHQDVHVPALIAFPPDVNLVKTHAYIDGKIILQDKASCFPAHLLLSGQSRNQVNGGIDGCAAPGNKTTHMAAIMRDSNCDGHILACERDAIRSQTLQTMVKKAGADKTVSVLQKQDFLALEPEDSRFSNVTHLLLDPSCSGSGIMRREDIPKLALPEDPRNKVSSVKSKPQQGSKKRKRESVPDETPDVTDIVETDAEAEAQPVPVDRTRLEKLSNLQSLIVEHAFAFPGAIRVTYSTCSIHIQENEAVVERVLASRVARARQWRVLRRDEQVEGLKVWKHRGVTSEGSNNDAQGTSHKLSDEQREACIRCTPDDGEGTMGFFVCGFVRDGAVEDDVVNGDQGRSEEVDEDAWDGFSDA